MVNKNDKKEDQAPSDRAKFGEHEISLDDVRQFLASSYPLVLKSTGVFVALAIVYLLVATPQFSSSAQLMIDASGSNDAFKSNIRRGSLDAASMESQLLLMSSRRVFQLVIDDVGIEILDPELAADKTLTKEDQASKAIKVLGNGMKVHRLGISQVIELTFTWPDRITAAKLANAFANAFIAEQFKARQANVSKGQEWLGQRIEELRKQLNQAATNIQKFKARRDYRINPNNAASKAGKTATKTNKRVDKGRLLTIMELETRAASYKKTYEIYLQAYADSLQRQLYPGTNTRIISKASPPLKKSHPKRLLTLLAAIIFGSFAGLGISLLRSALK